MIDIPRPKSGEYPEYAAMYMDLVPKNTSVLEHMKSNFDHVKDFVYGLQKEKLLFRYAEDKWSIKEVLVHIVDDERIYANRSLAFARNDKTIFPGFEEKAYTLYSDADNRDLDNIFEEYEAVRRSTIALFNGFTEAMLMRKGTASGNQATVRAMAYHIAGHELHHMKLIQERYL